MYNFIDKTGLSFNSYKTGYLQNLLIQGKRSQSCNFLCNPNIILPQNRLK